MALKKEKIEETQVEAQIETQVESELGGIEVGSPLDIRPKALPLVVKLPEDASKAQIEYAKTLNGYAYKNPVKWEQKKDELLKKLVALKNAPDPIEEVEGKVRVNKSIL